MSAMGDLFKNEKLLEKVATAETKEEAKKVCKEGGLEVTDAELDEVAGGLSTTAKVLIGVGATAATAGAAYGTYRMGKSKGWWCKEKQPSLQEMNEKYQAQVDAPLKNLAGVEGELCTVVDED